jgi:ATP-binding cassette subfamily B protein
MKHPKAEQKTPQSGLWGLLKPYKSTVVVLIILALLSSGINLVIPKLIATAIDDFSAARFVWQTVVLQFLVASVLIFCFSYLQSIVQTYVSEKVARNLRTELSDKISRQSYSYILKANPAKLLTNLTSDVDSVKMFVSHVVANIVSSIFLIVTTSVLLIHLNWKLAIVVISIVPLIGGSFMIVMMRVKVLFKKAREVIDRLNKTINESIIGAALVRVLNSQQFEFDKFMDSSTNARDIGMSILKMFAALIPIIMLIANLAIVSILALGGHFVVAGSMSLGEFAAFNTYLMLLIFPILLIGFMSNVIAQATASYGRVREVLDAPETIDPGVVKATLTGAIELKNVSLKYDEKPILKNISFSIAPGSRIAILGPTAAGKSQLLYLLTNLIAPTSGEILFDGRPITEFDKSSFHSQVGFVFQDSVIFNLSLRENIAFNEQVTDEAFSKAIATAELQDFIDSLPQKLDTIVSERGTSLSGGQKQRIMLARALALNPRILLLDDFTARVDRKTENRILCNLENNYPDLTLISVTQKVAPVRHFEQIILLMEGEVIASGTHNQLKESCPEYIQIYHSQRSTHHYEA